ncbi:bla regulator protein blaR1/beta-lactamase class D [Anaerovirgula multivorans]|uniref:Beta-lactamase n=1 Tax=Anaerovirgula multivorans TaxID=312168 RepID=A0A239GUM1_9FIRM|nr:class D beta-lactamase [Anaerovirgula multivorans]SNS72671.1 bla regulator protein blaR1/beta-lactamase class D [Anaerovirgula multivorans]
MKRRTLFFIIITILIIGSGCNKQTDTAKDVAINEIGLKQTNIVKDVETNEIDLKDFFIDYKGCFIIYDENESRYSIYNESQVDERLSPCSTFKIPSALIGLETGVIEGKDYVYQWDGKTNWIDSWNKDHTLATAITNSVVWYFQRLAQNVGEDRMQKYLDKIDYGNNDISGGITKFWLGSSLKVSAREQVEFLINLYHDKLPFDKENMKIVREIIILESTDGYVFSGKTGTADKGLGWFVGTIKKGDDIYYFATNIIGENDTNGPKAKEITKEILKYLKIYEN